VAPIDGSYSQKKRVLDALANVGSAALSTSIVESRQGSKIRVDPEDVKRQVHEGVDTFVLLLETAVRQKSLDLNLTGIAPAIKVAPKMQAPRAGVVAEVAYDAAYEALDETAHDLREEWRGKDTVPLEVVHQQLSHALDERFSALKDSSS
jgi:hypothetical protein